MKMRTLAGFVVVVALVGPLLWPLARPYYRAARCQRPLGTLTVDTFEALLAQRGIVGEEAE